MELTTDTCVVIAVDKSYSTYKCVKYYNAVNEKISSYPNALLIAWNHTAEFWPCRHFSKFGARGGTEIIPVLKLLQQIKKNIYLIIFTDGQVPDAEPFLLQNLDLQQYIRHVEIYMIGDEEDMNLKISSVFSGISQELHVNDNVPCPVNSTIDITLEKLLDCSLKATVISQLPHMTHTEKNSLAEKFKRFEHDTVQSLLKTNEDMKNQFLEWYQTRNVDAFVKYIKRYLYSPTDGMSSSQLNMVRSKIQHIINLLGTEDHSTYSLSQLKVLPQEVVLDDDPSNNDDQYENLEEIPFNYSSLECEILYTQCHHAGMLIRKPENALIQDHLRQFAESPFLLLNRPDIIQELIECVEYHVIDYDTFQQLPKKDISPFTRQKVKGIFVLHGQHTNAEKMVLHNSRSISILYGNENKLPGSLAAWNIVFLYAMSRYHPKWSEYQSLLWKEIRYVAEHTTGLMTLNPHIPPTMKGPLCVCLWYIAEVSPKAFPNSSKNLLRVLGKPYYEFYKDVYHDLPIDTRQLEAWDIWKYLIRNRKNAAMEVLAQYQDYRIIGQTVVFVHGACRERYGYLKQFDLSLVLQVYSLFVKKHLKLYDPLDLNDVLKEPVDFTLVLQQDDDEEIQDSSLFHIKICITTCLPYVHCPITGLHWKECAGEYNEQTESYVRLFRRYCKHVQAYPKRVEDLWLFDHERQLRLFGQCRIYNMKYIYFALNAVLDIYKEVMLKYDCVEFLSHTIYDEEIREKMEDVPNRELNVFTPYVIPETFPYVGSISEMETKSLKKDARPTVDKNLELFNVRDLYQEVCILNT